MRWIAGISACALIVGGAWAYFHFHSSSKVGQAASAAASAVQVVPAPPLGQDYTNSDYHFSLRMPEGFHAGELPNDAGGKTIILQDTSGQGVQIYVSPYPDDIKVLTMDDVRGNIPDMQVSDAQEVDIGNNYKGVAFLSDNEAFDGASREVWFVFNKNLYQISTYARFDPLLKEMFGAWKFY